MQIWVDADACPRPIKAILYRAAERVGIPLILVANQELFPPRSRWIRAIRVPSGFDVADHRIVALMKASVKAGEIEEFGLRQVQRWEGGEEEEIDGQTYQTGLAAYKRMTVRSDEVPEDATPRPVAPPPVEAPAAVEASQPEGQIS